MPSLVPAKPIGHLGQRLRPPLVRGPSNNNNILYNITFSSEKEKKKAVSHTEVTLFPSPNLLLAEEKIAKGRNL